MPDEQKACPKCLTEMAASQLVLGIPAMLQPGMQSKAISDERAYPVAAWGCPKCRYVELYYAGPQS